MSKIIINLKKLPTCFQKNLLGLLLQLLHLVQVTQGHHLDRVGGRDASDERSLADFLEAVQHGHMSRLEQLLQLLPILHFLNHPGVDELEHGLHDVEFHVVDYHPTSLTLQEVIVNQLAKIFRPVIFIFC